MASKIDFIAPGQKPGEIDLYVQGRKFTDNHYSTSKQYMEDLCIRNGTTLEGSYVASGCLLNGAYKRPIYVGGSCNQIFIPTSSIRNDDTVWVSLDYCQRAPMDVFNQYGYAKLSERKWQKHLSDGIALHYAIFEKGQEDYVEDCY